MSTTNKKEKEKKRFITISLSSALFVFPHDKSMLDATTKTFVMTNIFLWWQNLSQQAYFCHDKHVCCNKTHLLSWQKYAWCQLVACETERCACAHHHHHYYHCYPLPLWWYVAGASKHCSSTTQDMVGSRINVTNSWGVTEPKMLPNVTRAFSTWKRGISGERERERKNK